MIDVQLITCKNDDLQQTDDKFSKDDHLGLSHYLYIVLRKKKYDDKDDHYLINYLINPY